MRLRQSLNLPTVASLILFFCTFGITPCVAQTRAPKPQAIDLLIEILSVRSELSSSYKWHFETRQLVGGRKFRPSELGQLDLEAASAAHREDSDHFTRGNAIYDDITGRFCFEIEATMRWIGGASDVVSKRDQWCFDGTEYTRLTKEYPGVELPSADDADTNAGTPAEAHISKSLSDPGGLAIYRRQSGMSAFPDFLPTPLMGFPERTVALPYALDLVAEWIANGYVHDVQLQGNTLLLQLIAPEGGKHCVEYSFDMDRGGAVTRILMSAQPGTPPFAVTTVQNKEWMPGIWAPFRIETLFLLDGNGARTSIDSVEIDPPLDDVEFRVHIPAGTTVWDESTNMGYTTINSPGDQAAKVREFMAENDIRLEPKSQFSYRTIFIAVNIVFFVGLIFYFWRRSSGSR